MLLPSSGMLWLRDVHTRRVRPSTVSRLFSDSLERLLKRITKHDHVSSSSLEVRLREKQQQQQKVSNVYF